MPGAAGCYHATVIFGHFASWGIFGLLLTATALIHYFKKRPDFYWFFIIIFLAPLGALIYLAVEMLPELRDPGTFNFLHRRSRIHLLQAMVRENPSPGNYEELGQLCLDAHDWQAARVAFDHALARRTDSIDPFYRRAIAEMELGDFAAARADLERVTAADAGYDLQRAVGLLAHCWAKTGETERAKQLFEQVLKTSTLTETQLHYAQFLAARGDKAASRAMARRILDKRAGQPGFLKRRERKYYWQARLLLR